MAYYSYLILAAPTFFADYFICDVWNGADRHEMQSG